MRKKFVSGKRVLALVLALSMVVGEASFVSAAPAEAADVAVEETVEVAESAVEETVAEETDAVVEEAAVEATEEAVVEEATETAVVEEATEETVVEEAVVEATEEVAAQETEAEEVVEEATEEVAAETAFDGTVSTVIGVKAYSNFTDNMTDKDGNPVYYSCVNRQNVTNNGWEEKVLAGTDREQYYDKSTGLYLVDGKYYPYINGEGNWDADDNYVVTKLYVYEANAVTVLPVSATAPDRIIEIDGQSYVVDKTYNEEGIVRGYYRADQPIVPVVTVKDYESAEKYVISKAVRFDGKAIEEMYDYADYYDCDGRYFTGHLSCAYVKDNCIVYGNANNEISFTSEAAKVEWTPLTTDNVYVYGDSAIQIGYQVEENGAIAEGTTESADKAFSFVTDASYTSKKAYAPGTAMSFRVRGLYYVTDKEGKITVIKTGEWSEAAATQIGTRAVMPAVSGLTGVINGSTFDLNWNKIPQAENYEVRVICSNVPVPVDASNWKQFYNREGEAYQAFRTANANNEDFTYVTNNYWYDDNYLRFSYNARTPYYYIAVGVSNANEPANYEFYSNGCFENTFTYANLVAPTSANVPAVTGWEVQYVNGSYQLKWNPVDANMVIFAYEEATLPANYTSKVSMPRSDEYVSLSSKLTSANIAQLNKVQYDTVNGLQGTIDVNDYFNVEVGKTMYFVACTYDTTFESVSRTPIVVDGVSFTKYADFGPATVAVAVANDISAPEVATAMTDKAITLTMTGADNATGFEIYKKTGKKYKKIATTNDWQYVDTDVKAGKTYSYKVRAYYYNTKTKRSAYSSYVYAQATASAGKNIDLTVTKKSKTSALLNWTKVDGATKYEIYRSNETNADPSVVSKKYDSAKTYAKALSNAKYELVKTINKASTIKYLDKKLTVGDSYSYVVVAYFKEGKKIAYVNDSGSVYLGLDGVKLLTSKMSGSTAKISWKKNPNATKYEIEYTVYNPAGLQAKAPVKTSTKKTSFSIKNIPAGGYAVVKVRVYGNYEKSNGKTGKGYSDWSNTRPGKDAVSVVKGVKAVNESVNGKDAVKISWKAVKGAAYYRVFRSLRATVYNADEKTYAVTGTTIDKESNDDENNDSVKYRMYNDEYDTITGTSVYDFAQLDSGVKYYYFVVAYDANDNCKFAANALTSVVYKIGDASIKKIASSKGKVTVTINKVAGAKSYEIYRSTKKSSDFEKIGTTKKTSFVDKKASKGKTYYYKVVAVGNNALKAQFTTNASAAKKIKVK